MPIEKEKLIRKEKRLLRNLKVSKIYKVIT